MSVRQGSDKSARVKRAAAEAAGGGPVVARDVRGEYPPAAWGRDAEGGR